MDLDFEKICRVCLNEGIMMSIFKVNVSKKMMACASVQVWQNDGLPTQICNKCSAKLHISFQFKRLCEKSDAKLRQYMSNMPLRGQPREELQQTEPVDITEKQYTSLELPQQLTQPQPSQDACVFIEFSQPQPPLTQINYNMQTQSHLQLGYTLPNVAPVQYNGTTYSMPLQQMQPVNVLHSQVMAPNQMHIQPEQQLPQLQSVMQQPLPTLHGEDEIKDKVKKEEKIKKDSKSNENKQCNTCGKIFTTSAKLTRHVKIHSADMPHKCNICNKAFSHGGNYKIHLRTHTDERPFLCNICNKGCRQAQDLEKHMRIHTGERPHKCHLCPRAFSTSSNLIAHIRTHTGERPYVCCVCQKAFCQSNELTKHMRTHTGEKSHICDICHKGFNGSSTLIVHRRSHTGEKPYVCSVCNKGFAQSSCLAVHMKRHNGEKNFTCSQCNRAFVTNADLKEHYSTHVGDKHYNCSMCGETYTKLCDLNKHLKTHSSADES